MGKHYRRDSAPASYDNYLDEDVDDDYDDNYENHDDDDSRWGSITEGMLRQLLSSSRLRIVNLQLVNSLTDELFKVNPEYQKCHHRYQIHHHKYQIHHHNFSLVNLITDDLNLRISSVETHSHPLNSSPLSNATGKLLINLTN